MATGSVDTVRLRGTSISTPMVAREAFNLIKATGATAAPIVPLPLVGLIQMLGTVFLSHVLNCNLSYARFITG